MSYTKSTHSELQAAENVMFSAQELVCLANFFKCFQIMCLIYLILNKDTNKIALIGSALVMSIHTCLYIACLCLG